MKKRLFGMSLVPLMLHISMPAFAQVERVTTAIVSNPQALITTMEQYRENGETESRSVSLLRHIHDGQDPSTHSVVALYDDLEDMEKEMDSRPNSAAWATLLRSVRGNAEVTSSFLAIQRSNWGDDFWKERDYLVAIALRAAGDGELLAAMDEMMSASKLKIPGMIRLMRVRGNPMGTHAVLISASSYEDLINYQESMEASAPFAEMRSTGAAAPQGALYYRVLRVID